jgi:hypothetical protein
MPIPDTQQISEILSGIEVSREIPKAGDLAAQIPFLPAIDETGLVLQQPLWLYYPSHTAISFIQIVDRINKELRSVRHPWQDDFGIFALAVAALAPSTCGGMVERVNRVISLVCDADVSLYYAIVANNPHNYHFEIPPFTIGALQVQKLRYKSDKAGSDFFKRYQRELEGSWAIEREPQAVRVLDYYGIQENMFGGRNAKVLQASWKLKAAISIFDWYFSLYNRVLFDHFLIS